MTVPVLDVPRIETKEEAFALLDKAVEARGEYYTQDRCIYVKNVSDDPDVRTPYQSTPNCIAAVALSFHGVPVDYMARWWDGRELEENSIPIDKLARLGYVSFLSDEALSAFSQAQDNADSGNTWGDSVRWTKQEMGILQPED